MTFKLPYKQSRENREYSGWTSYETCVVRLHINNDVKIYTKHMDAAAAVLRKHGEDHHSACVEFREALEHEFEDKSPFNRNDVYADLLRGALDAVNWWEIAVNWMTDIELSDESEVIEQKMEEPAKSADRMQAVASRCKHTLTATTEVLAILQRSTIDEEGLTLPGEQLPRDKYEAVNKFLELAGAKWNKSKRRHVFKRGAKTKIEALLASGQIEERRRGAKTGIASVDFIAVAARGGSKLAGLTWRVSWLVAAE